MDVSNSSDQNTGYRVMGGGQAPVATKDVSTTQSGSIRPPKILHHGRLLPHEYVTIDLKEEASAVEFDLDGQTRPLRVKLSKGDSRHLLVALVANGKGVPKPVVCQRQKPQGGSAA